MKAFVKKIIPLPVRALILRGLTYFPDRRALSLPLPERTGKTALISYVTAPFKEGAGSTLFTHAGIPKMMVQALHELGYSVDVVEWSNTVFTPRKKYDLFIGHAGRNFQRIADRLERDCTKIYFSTGTYWKEHNRREEERFAWLEQRRGVRLPYDRRITDSEERANESADGIICLGNHVARESYSQFPLVLSLNNATYDCRGDLLLGKDHEVGRTNFLFLASLGNVHKGLDLLLEAFSQPAVQSAAHLYICQQMQPEFFSLYQDALENTPNIHFVGHLNLRSTQFQELAGKCSFMIHPSCAEGQPGAVLDCMGHGLIPVLTRENHIDIEGYGFTIPASVTEIAKTVQRLSCLSPEECRLRAQRTLEAAAMYSGDSFIHAMKDSIQTIVDNTVVDSTAAKKLHCQQ